MTSGTEYPSAARKKTASLSVEMTQTGGPNPVTTAGQELIYQIILKNTGDINLTQVTVTETYPGTGSGTIRSADNHGSLKIGEKWIYTVKYKVSQADITAGTELINTISVVTKQLPDPAIETVTTLVAPPTGIKYDATIIVTPYNVTYDGKTHVATGTATGINGEDLSGLLMLNGTIHTNAGIYTDNWTFAGNINYNSASGVVNNTIGKAALTITADSRSKVYGLNDPALTYQITSGELFGTDVLNGSLTRVAGENVSNTYAITQGTLGNSNYLLSYVGANLTITPLPVSVFAEPMTKIYGQIDPVLALISSPTVGTVLNNGQVISFAGSLSREPGETVLGSPYVIKQGSLFNSNYIITYVGASLSITPLPVSVLAENKYKYPGETDPALNYLSDPAVGTILPNGQIISFTGSLSRAPGEFVGAYPIGQNTLNNSNYTIAYTGASLYILSGNCQSHCIGIAITQTAGPNPVTAAGQVITYQIVLSNDALLYWSNGIGVVLTWEYTGTGLGTLCPKIESITSDNVLEHFETWTYLATYTVTDEDITRGWDLNNFFILMADDFGPGMELITTPVAGTKSFMSKGINLTNLDTKIVKTDLQGEFDLKVYPNPFTDIVYFDLQMKTDSKVRLEVFNIEGVRLSTVYDDLVVAYDRYRFEYTPTNFSTGVLIYRLTVDGQLIFTGKLIHY
jgi:hypothetical protein